MNEALQQTFMKEAYKQAIKAAKKGEVPIGAVVVVNNQMIARAHNNREGAQNAVNHAELLAISKACKKLGSWRLDDATLFVTLEPCLMCAGAVLNARIKQVYFAVCDNNAALRSVASQPDASMPYQFSALNHTATFTKSVLETECKQLLQTFFTSKRKG